MDRAHKLSSEAPKLATIGGDSDGADDTMLQDLKG